MSWLSLRADAYGCSGAPVRIASPAWDRLTKLVYQDCTSALAHYRIADLHHDWASLEPNLENKRASYIDATYAMWMFFQRHPLHCPAGRTDDETPAPFPERGPRRSCRCQLVGMSTESMRYTVAFAVWTPPQTTFAPLTMSMSPSPVTSTVPPCTVVWSPTTISGESCPGTTW